MASRTCQPLQQQTAHAATRTAGTATLRPGGGLGTGWSGTETSTTTRLWPRYHHEVRARQLRWRGCPRRRLRPHHRFQPNAQQGQASRQPPLATRHHRSRPPHPRTAYLAAVAVQASEGTRPRRCERYSSAVSPGWHASAAAAMQRAVQPAAQRLTRLAPCGQRRRRW